jgi:hypothetical protein
MHQHTLIQGINGGRVPVTQFGAGQQDAGATRLALESTYNFRSTLSSVF